MERLGKDELALVFEKITSRIDQQSFVEVSKKFMVAVCVKWKTVSNSLPHLLFKILPASPNLIRFNCNKPLYNKHMRLLAKSCPNVRSLCLDLPELGDVDFEDDGLCAIARSCRDLRRVRLRNRLGVGDQVVASLVRSCKNLEVLHLEGCVRITDEALKPSGEVSSLEYLCLEGCLITDLGLQYLGSGDSTGDLKNSLDILNLSRCDRITDSGLTSLKQMVGLRILNLSRCGVVGLVSRLPKIANLHLS